MPNLNGQHPGRRRYRTFSDYLSERFGTRVYKATIDAGFTCPNRDGSAGVGGCTYCNNEGFSVNSRRDRASALDVRKQLEQGARFLRRRYKAEKFLAYFQAYTNTYAPVEELRALYDAALEHPDVVGLDVGTRPDCVPDDVLELLREYTNRTGDVWLELGLQSANDATLKRINRRHDAACFFDAMERAKGRGLKLCVHVILGLPGESREDMLHTARALSGLEYHGLKLHLLHVNRDTALAREYERGELRTLTMKEYATLAVDFLEYVPPDVVIQRLTGEGAPDVLIAPKWCLSKSEALNAIHDEMERRDFHQGSRLTARPESMKI
ncbi:TIGR01212 family radical SAM protein [Candidatus Sumerlaeota bacterium]|nr:TIGR01212 family radical SAM protein [Candidatus Sumerlaeota bacterium]